MQREQSNPFLVSVIMAVYNVESFLSEAVDSLIVQDIGFKNIQLIMVDDGSTDRSGAICDEYAKQYPPNIIVIHKKNGGVASARNEGLKYATGEYLNFMDSDDRFLPDALGKMFRFFEAHKEETNMVTLPLMFFDAQKGEHWQNRKFKQGNRVIDLQKEPNNALMFVNATLFSGKLREIMEFDASLPCGEDIKVIYTLLAKKPAIGVVGDSYYMYRRRSIGEASLVGSAHGKRSWYFEYFQNLVDWIMEYYQDSFGEVPCFVQYVFAQEMQWRFHNETKKDTQQALRNGVLTQEEYNQYREKLAETLRCLDDKLLFGLPYASSGNLAEMLTLKYGSLQAIPGRSRRYLMISWYPRTIQRGFRCCKDHGIRYTVKYAFQKIRRGV